MKIKGLIPLYSDIKRKNETYSCFDYCNGGVNFEVSFDIFEIPFKLFFVVKEQNYRLSIDVQQVFIINPILIKSEYKALAHVLGLTFDPKNPFSPPQNSLTISTNQFLSIHKLRFLKNRYIDFINQI